MVLQKIGETATEIQVNGTTEGNFTQVNDSVYDIATTVTDQNFTQSNSRSGDFSNVTESIYTLGGPVSVQVDYFVEVGWSASVGGNFYIRSSEGILASATNEGKYSGTVTTTSDYLNLTWSSGNSVVANYDITVTFPSSLTVDSVTQQ